MKQIEIDLADQIALSHDNHDINEKVYLEIALEVVAAFQRALEPHFNDSVEVLVNVVDGEPSEWIN